MHDTAFAIGTLAMNIYADLRTDSVLEVGSQAINGSLRESALPTTRYVGVDIEEGEGVDLVIEPGKPLPVQDNSFDLVMATSVFEHDPAFWMTFLEMCRATKDGGYVYINAPSNGIIHRYPQDNWRFYPDSGKALAAWAASQGAPVALVESFIAKRDRDIWNDFVAVFRKGPIKKTLPKVFLHENVACTDVITWKSKEIMNASEQTEDVILLTEAHERANVAEVERDDLAKKVSELKASLESMESEHQLQRGEAERVKTDLNLRESELRQRHEEIEQTRRELTQSRGELQGARQRCELERRLRQKAELALEAKGRDWEAQLDAVRAQHQEAETALGDARDRSSELESRLTERFQEIACLTEMLAAAESAERSARERLSWLSETSLVLANGSDSLKAKVFELFPAILDRKRRERILKRKGLFDPEAYLMAHPDVLADHADPLRHYLRHGIVEDRRRD